MTRNLSAAGAARQQGEFAVLWIDGKTHEAVVFTIGRVGKVAVAGEDDVRATRGSVIVLRKQTDLLQRVQGPFLRVPSQHFNLRNHFVNAAGEPPIGMESQRARAGARGCIPLRRVIGRELRARGVEVVDVNAVQAQIVDQQEAIVRAKALRGARGATSCDPD